MTRLLENNTIFADYQVVAKISHHHNGQREVYHAVHRNTGEPVALTVYDLGSPCYASDGSEPERDCIMEMTFLRSHGATSSAFATVVDSGVTTMGDKTLAWMVQEYCNAHSLTDVINNCAPLPLHTTLAIMRVLNTAASEIYIYTQGGGHYGISPDNILVDIDDDKNVSCVKLIGLTNIGGQYSGSMPFFNNERNRKYCAPENARGLFSHYTDIYALGMVMASMLCGTDDAAASSKKLSPTLRLIIARATQTDTEERFRTADKFQYFLSKFSAGKISTQTYSEPLATGVSEPSRQGKQKLGQKNTGSLDDVAGMGDLKDLFRRNFVRIVRNPAMAKAYGVTPSNILMYGPPGCGKTFIAEKAAQESGLNYKIISPSDLGSIYIHGAQGKIAETFKEAEKNAPMILIFDEFDAIAPKRDDDLNASQAGEVNELLTQLNNCVDKGIYVMTLTNNPQRLDSAVLRSGRMDMMFYVSLPDLAARREIFELELKKRPCADDIDTEALAKATENFTCSDVSFVVKECARRCFDETVNSGADMPVPISQSKILGVIKATRSSVSAEDIKAYAELKDKMESRDKKNNRPRVGFTMI